MGSVSAIQDRRPCWALRVIERTLPIRNNSVRRLHGKRSGRYTIENGKQNEQRGPESSKHV